MTDDFVEFLYTTGIRLSRQSTEIANDLKFTRILAETKEASSEVEYAIKYCESSLRVFLLRIRDLEQIAIRNKKELVKQKDLEEREE